MTPHRILASSLALCLLCTATGCPKKAAPTPAPAAGALPTTGKDLGGNLGPPPVGGSTTLPGRIRDKAVLAQVLNDLRGMGVIFTNLELQGMSPATVARRIGVQRTGRRFRRNNPM